MKCIICGQEKDSTIEHIIPESIGNREFITHKVCKECNSGLGRNIDGYVLNSFPVKLMRKNMGLTGKKGGNINIFPNMLKDDNGNKYLVRDDKPLKAPKIESDERKIHIEASTEEEALSLARKILKRQRVSDEKIEEIINTRSAQKKVLESPTFPIDIDIDLSIFMLFGIKIAYEYACEILGDLYWNDPIAKTLRTELQKGAMINKTKLELDFDLIRKHVNICDPISKKINDYINIMKNECKLPIRHICMLHPDAEGKLICQIILLNNELLTFTVLISEDISKYKSCFGINQVVCVMDDGSMCKI